MSTPANGLSQQTIIMLSGREINRAIKNVTGRTWQQGTISVNGTTIDVYRDTTQGTSWHEKKVEQGIFKIFDEYIRLTNLDVSAETPRYQLLHRNRMEGLVHDLFHLGYLLRDGRLVDKTTMQPIERPQEQKS